MTALACLRILPDPGRAPSRSDIPAAGVRRVVAAFLVGRWSRPRRFGEVTPGVFLLTEPLADHIDPDELIALAMELQQEPVTLALLTGDEAAATLFSALHPADLRAVLAGRLVVDGMAGAICRITPDGVAPMRPGAGRPPLRLIMDGVGPTDAARSGPELLRTG